jgi:naphthoate synthase
VEGFDLTDITYHRANEAPVVRIAFERPEVRNAFRPHIPSTNCSLRWTMPDVFRRGRGAAHRERPSPKDGGWAFCSGGDQRIRGRARYQYDSAVRNNDAALGRLHILEVQRLIRFMPKVVIALVNGWAAGGGHSLHVVCDLSLASASMLVQADRRRRRLIRRWFWVRVSGQAGWPEGSA